MKATQNQNTYDVIIAGAGPVGLFLACELALAKCSVLILEKAADPHSPIKQLPFGLRGLSAPSIEALYRRGLLEQLEVHKKLKNPHQNAKQGAERQVGHFAGIPFTEGNVDQSRWEHRLPGSPGPSLMTTMDEMETVLTRRAEALGVEIKRGLAITGFEQNDSGVTVLWDSYSFNSKWLVGCDGARSAVRKLGGFEFAGTEPEFTGYSTRIDLADPEKLNPGRNVTSRGMYLQSQPGYVLMQDFDGGAFHSSEQPVTLQHIQEVLRRVSGTDVTVTALHMATTWTDRARQATTYRNGRIFLAGDAAHIHAPLGGQGLNLGLGDAMNLGWKLAAAIHQQAPGSLLDTYYDERYPVGMQVLDWSRAQVAIMKPDASSRALYAIISDLMNTNDGATYFAGRVWGIHTHYNLGDDQPLLGYSVPDFELADGTRIGKLMSDGRGLLIDFGGDASLKALAATYSHQLKYVSGPAKDQLGLSAVLVRPDGIIAWVAGNEPDFSKLQKAAERWFVRN
ncbi:FAD-dependent monooxygenase [Mucilaginibacter celer]|uniref:FAD-dependent oxidoreductase n=1 Tax=Mucilaginibacter celer TaxID=2305508 RepID=A0A494VTV4_9SPHI|nr:FAD-dependent monooxygenase [Mucilaginibacter celer]AYL97799.1 FAD-dependent oxidoreductase [Mucilaginibacter celer]